MTAPTLTAETYQKRVAMARERERTRGDRRRGNPHVEYQRRPIDWMVDKLGIRREHIVWSEIGGPYETHKWDGTQDPLKEALEALANWEWVGVEAGTGVSKTWTLAAAGSLWFLACFEDSIVVSLAPKEKQLTMNMWKELHEHWPAFQRHFPQAKLQTLKIRMRGGLDEKWAATGFAAGVGAHEESAKKARGFHAQHALYIFEDATGVHAAIYGAIENTATAPHNLVLALGNPDHQQDELHRLCVQSHVRHIRMSAYDFPNVVLGDPDYMPGGVSRESIDHRAGRWGKGSGMFDRMIRGISPAQAEDALIRWEWCVEAAKRQGRPDLLIGPRALGADVAASEAGDKGAISRWVGATCREVPSFPCPDPYKLGADIAVEMAVEGIDPLHVGVDSAGVGGGTVDKLKSLDYLVQALNGGDPQVVEIETHEPGSPVTRPVRMVEKFRNLRAQMHWRMRLDLQHGRIALPNDEELWQDLCTPVWWTHGGRIYVEPKEDIVKRLGRSPDKGDACVYGNWVRPRTLEEVEERPFTAWSQEALEREAEEGRRVRERPTRKVYI
jgi:hypothetical protein